MKLSIWLTGLASTNAVLGLVYNWYLLTTLGPGRHSDALFAGLMVPQLLLAVLGGSLSNVLVPMLATEDEKGFSRLAWTTLHAVFLVGTVTAMALGLVAPLWVPLTVPGFDFEAVSLTVALLRIQLLGVILSLVLAVQRSAYNARQRFLWAEASATLAMLGGFGFLLVGLPRIGVAAAAWATVLRSGLQVTFLLRGMGRYLRPNWRGPQLRRLWHQLHPLLLGSVYYKSDLILDRLLASLAPPGLLSLYYLASQLWSSGYLILSKAIAGPAVPLLARAATRRDWYEFRKINRQRLGALLGIAIAAYGILLVAGHPLLTLLFERSRFSPEQVRQLWWLLVALGGMWIGGAAGQIVATSFYAQGDTRTLMRIGALWFTIGVGLKLIGFHFFGVLGLAAGASLAYLISATAQQIVLERRHVPAVPAGPPTPTSVET